MLFFKVDPLHQPDDGEYQSYNKQNIDQSTQKMSGEPKHPQNQDNNNYYPKPIAHF
jgi:hypothetical protein